MIGLTEEQVKDLLKNLQVSMISEGIESCINTQFTEDNKVELLTMQVNWSGNLLGELLIELTLLHAKSYTEVTHCRALLSQLDNELEICELDQRARIDERIAETSSRLGFVLKTSGQLQTLLKKMGLSPERKEGDECNCPMCSALEN